MAACTDAALSPASARRGKSGEKTLRDPLEHRLYDRRRDRVAAHLVALGVADELACAPAPRPAVGKTLQALAFHRHQAAKRQGAIREPLWGVL